MTAPDKIWTAPTDGKCHVGFDTKSMNYTIEYTRTDLAQAAVAAAYEAAAQAVGWEAYVADTSPQYLSDWQRGLVAGQQAMSKAIRALAAPDQIAALAAKIDASQAPNPAVNGGRCQSDTIPLPRAEVEALMDLLRRAKHCIGDNYLHWQGEAGVALATLQERMK